MAGRTKRMGNGTAHKLNTLGSRRAGAWQGALAAGESDPQRRDELLGVAAEVVQARFGVAHGLGATVTPKPTPYEAIEARYAQQYGYDGAAEVDSGATQGGIPPEGADAFPSEAA